MQFKTIFKSLLLTYLCSSAYAAPSKDECKDLKAYLTGNKASSLSSCKNNSKGEISELKVSSENLSKEDYAKIFSYTTIKKLEYYDEYSDCAGLKNGISNLKNLEELNVKSFRGSIAPGVLKDLKSLKSFTFNTGDYDYSELSQENINDLSTLSNLRNLKLVFVPIHEDKLNFSPLKNLKVTSLTLETNGKAGIRSKELIKNLKNLKELTIKDFKLRDEEIKAIKSSKSLEKLIIDNDDIKEVPKYVYEIPNLKKVKFNGKEVAVNNKGSENNGNNANGASGNVAGDAAAAGATATNATAIATTTPITNATTTPLNPANTAITSGSSAILVRSINYLPLIIVLLKVMF
eukprot:jgi/Orpsp1_1/1178329/evm.model.c7180000064880.1